MQSETMCCGACCDFLLVAVFLGVAGGKELVWKYDSDIGNVENWVGGKLGEDCKGLHFAEVNSASVLIHELVTAEVTLPRDGEILLEIDGFIEFKDNKKCINLKPINNHDWYDPDSWRLKGSNVAIPDKEKIPCVWDDVVFPKIEHTSITFSMHDTPFVSSIRTNKQEFTGEGHYRLGTKSQFDVGVYKFKCRNPYGCLCHLPNIFCPTTENSLEKKKLPCNNPVTPEDFCHEICGAYLTYRPGAGPDLATVAQKLKEFDEIDTHVSSVQDYLGLNVVQIVFTEREFTGRSLENAESFLEYLQGSHAERVQIFKSGEFYREGGSSWSIVFGTLFGVVVFFGVLLYLHGDRNISVIISRLHRSRGSIFSTPFFARFDNIDENLIIDGQSESGSILDIAKSFDNPMYGASTSSTQEEKSQGKTFDNPMFGQGISEEPIQEKSSDNNGTVPEIEPKPFDFDNPLYGAPLLDVTKAATAEE